MCRLGHQRRSTRTAPTINNNPSSLNAQRNLEGTTVKLNRLLERLSSGLRISRASDDPAGLAISESLRADIASYEQAKRNASDGISLLQIAEGALAESSSLLTRLRQLSVQSANSSLGTNERNALNSEFQLLVGEISRIANVTEFNGTSILNNSGLQVNFQVGIGNGSNNQILVSGVNATAGGLAISGLAIATSAGASAAISAIDAAVGTLASRRSQLGTAQNRLESTIRSISVAVKNNTAAESRVRDVDVAEETSRLTRLQVLQQAGFSVLAQANLTTQTALQLLCGVVPPIVRG